MSCFNIDPCSISCDRSNDVTVNVNPPRDYDVSHNVSFPSSCVYPVQPTFSKDSAKPEITMSATDSSHGSNNCSKVVVRDRLTRFSREW